MKLLIGLLFSLFTFAAHADVGDTYTVFGKVGRMNKEMGLIEIIGVQYLLDFDGPGPLRPTMYKLQIDVNEDFYGNDLSEMMFGLLSGITQYKLMAGVVFTPAIGMGGGIQLTNDCLGKDFEFLNPLDAGATKTCFKIQFKDFIVK